MSRYLDILRRDRSEKSEVTQGIEADISPNSLSALPGNSSRYLSLIDENKGPLLDMEPRHEDVVWLETAPASEPEILIVPGAKCLICNQRFAACTPACPRWCLKCQEEQEKWLSMIRLQQKAVGKQKQD